MAGQKKYTDITMNHSYYYKDKEKKAESEKVNFISVALDGLVCSPDPSCRVFDNGKKVINFRVPIHNQGKYIENMCGLAPMEDDNGTAWAAVSMWDSVPEHPGVATRFENLMKKVQGKTVVMTIVGQITVADEKDKKTGKTYRNTRIKADSFFGVRIFDKKNGGSNGSTASSTAASNGISAPPAQSSGFCEIDDDEDLPF